MKIFHFNSYVEYLLDEIENHNHIRGYKTKLSEAASCQKSYLTQVLQNKAHFTPEHAFNTSHFLELEEIEVDYFCLLVDFERAGTMGLKSKIKRQLQNLRSKSSNLDQQIIHSKVSKKISDLEYYSAWYTQAVHLATACDNYKDCTQISDFLNLPEKIILKTLHFLEEKNLVSFKEGGWHYQGSPDIHISPDSQITSLIHSNWRNKAISSSSNYFLDNLHYTSVQVHDQDDFYKIKDLLIEVSQKSRQITLESKCDSLYCFNLDFFKI